MKSSLFPDVNVWLALTHARHRHHPVAAEWLAGRDEQLYFCRFTQLGLLRLLTTPAVMGPDVLSGRDAWRVYHRWFEDERVELHREPESAGFEALFEKLSTTPYPSAKIWADAYLAAFAASAGLKVVTFDRRFPRLPLAEVQILAAKN